MKLPQFLKSVRLLFLFILVTGCSVDHMTYVYDTKGNPIEGVTIIFNDEIYKTDSLGFVKLHQTRSIFGGSMRFRDFKKENHKIQKKNDTNIKKH